MSGVVIGLSGYAQSGKDTLGDYLRDQYGFVKMGFADALRDAMLALDPWVMWGSIHNPVRWSSVVEIAGYERAKKETDGREIMQRLGTEAVRNILGDDAWVRAAELRMPRDTNVVFTDVRFPNEAEMIHRHGGEVWRVHRPGFAPVNPHPSETALDDFSFDFDIANDGAREDLYRNADLLMQWLLPVPDDRLGLLGAP